MNNGECAEAGDATLLVEKKEQMRGKVSVLKEALFLMRSPQHEPLLTLFSMLVPTRKQCMELLFMKGTT